MEVRSKTQNLSTMDKYETMSGLVENFLGGWLVGWWVAIATKLKRWSYGNIQHCLFPTRCFIYNIHEIFMQNTSSSWVLVLVELSCKQVINCIPAAPVPPGPTVSSHLSSWHCNISHYSTATGPELLLIPVDTSKTDFLVIWFGIPNSCNGSSQLNRIIIID